MMNKKGEINFKISYDIKSSYLGLIYYITSDLINYMIIRFMTLYKVTINKTSFTKVVLNMIV